MSEQERPQWQWINLTDELLNSERERLQALIAAFEPIRKEGHEMTAWLADCVSGGVVVRDTWLCVKDDQLLGFFAVEPAEIDFTGRAAFPVLQVRRKANKLSEGPQPGLMLSAIARSKSKTEKQFGRNLLLHALARAMEDPRNVAVFVRPANEELTALWMETHRFKAMDKPAPAVPDVLWYPVDPQPEGDWG